MSFPLAPALRGEGRGEGISLYSRFHIGSSFPIQSWLTQTKQLKRVVFAPRGRRKSAWGKLAFERRPRSRSIMVFGALNGHGNQSTPRFLIEIVRHIVP